MVGRGLVHLVVQFRREISKGIYAWETCTPLLFFTKTRVFLSSCASEKVLARRVLFTEIQSVSEHLSCFSPPARACLRRALAFFPRAAYKFFSATQHALFARRAVTGGAPLATWEAACGGCGNDFPGVASSRRNGQPAGTHDRYLGRLESGASGPTPDSV